MQPIKRIIGFPLDESYRSAIEQSMRRSTEKSQWVLGVLILISQIAMIAATFLRPGGISDAPDRIVYVALYVALAAMSLVVLLAYFAMRKRTADYTKSFFMLSGTYAAFIALWSCVISTLDRTGGGDISVFTYVILTVAAFATLRPWQMFAIFGCSAIAVNVLPFMFFDDAALHFGMAVNSAFVVLLASAVSTMLYRYRVFSCYDKMVIEQQYQKIEQINRELNREVMQDDLTGIHNRRYLETSIFDQIEACWESGRPVACMMLDIDFFKSYNDHYGHLQGDVCLQDVASTIKEFAESEGGNAVRYGGEEFIVCFLDCDGGQAAELAERLRRHIADRSIPRDDVPKKHITVSIGVHACNKESRHSLIGKTDQALYEAKKHGRDCVVFHQGS